MQTDTKVNTNVDTNVDTKVKDDRTVDMIEMT